MKDFFTVIGAVVIGVLFISFVAVLFSFPVMWLWNWLVPEIFGLPTITWLQAMGLGTLSGLLFKGSASASSK